MESQTAGADRIRFGQDRAVLEESVIALRQLIEISAEQVRLELPRDRIDHFSLTKDVFRQRQLVRRFQFQRG